MQTSYYTAKEVAEVLKTSIQTVYRKAKTGDLPSEGKRPNIRFPKEAIDIIVESDFKDDEEDEKLTFTTSTLADAWIKQQMNHPYADEDSVPYKTVVSWYKKNNNIGRTVKRGNKIVGWVTALPLYDDVIENLLNGVIKEKDIREQDIRKWNEKNLSVYVPIIEVPETGNKEADKRVGRFLVKYTIKWAGLFMEQYDIRKWYAIGVTPDGQRLLEDLQFDLLSSNIDETRKNYVFGVSKPKLKVLTKLLEQIGERPQGADQINVAHS
ncbi:MAG: helix-turn-helix domain-containing protein [Ktedonobacteraceae bacterium]